MGQVGQEVHVEIVEKLVYMTVVQLSRQDSGHHVLPFISKYPEGNGMGVDWVSLGCEA